MNKKRKVFSIILLIEDVISLILAIIAVVISLATEEKFVARIISTTALLFFAISVMSSIIDTTISISKTKSNDDFSLTLNVKSLKMSILSLIAVLISLFTFIIILIIKS